MQWMVSQDQVSRGACTLQAASSNHVLRWNATIPAEPGSADNMHLQEDSAQSTYLRITSCRPY